MKNSKEYEKIDNAWYITGWIAIAVLLCYLVMKRIMGENMLKIDYPCMIHLITGFFCPGCGGTRAVKAFLSGKVITSFFYHPLVPYAAVLCGWFMISQTIQRITRNRIKIAIHFREIYLWIALIIIVVNCLIKNIALGIFHVDLLDF